MRLNKIVRLFHGLTKRPSSPKQESKRASLVCLELSAWGEKSELLSAAAQLLMNGGNRTEALSCALMIAPSLERFRALVEIGIADLKKEDPNQALAVFKQAIQSLPMRKVDQARLNQLANIVVSQVRCGDIQLTQNSYSLAA